MRDHEHHMKKLIKGIDLGDYVEVYVCSEFKQGDDGRWIPKGIDCQNMQMSPFVGYVSSLSLQELILTNRYPLVQQPEDTLPEISESLTKIPYDNIFEVNKLYRDSKQSE